MRIGESELERFIEAGGDVRASQQPADASADDEVASARGEFDRSLNAAATAATDGDDVELVAALRRLAVAAETLAATVDASEPPSAD